MVVYNLMRLDRQNQIRDKMEIIHEEYFGQFVAGVILWYQHQISHPTVYFEHKWLEPKPPNLFNMFEYPNLYTDTIVNLFVESDAQKIMIDDERPYHEARDIAVDTFNNANLHYRDQMNHDVSAVLDGYHMFYCYQDDAFDLTNFHNPYVKEVW